MKSNNPPSHKFLKERQFFVILPIFVLPFLTFSLWSVGLIGEVSFNSPGSGQKGFNASLPHALPASDSNWNKLRFYEQADKDSAQLRTLRRNDPSYSLSAANSYQAQSTDSNKVVRPNIEASPQSYNPYPAGLQLERDPNEEKVNKKLVQLQLALNKSGNLEKFGNDDPAISFKGKAPDSINSADMQRLQQMMQTMDTKENSADPELQQISGMLEKVLDIQHPERVSEKLKQRSKENMKTVFPVIAQEKRTPISLLGGRNIDSAAVNRKIQDRNAFYSLDDYSKPDDTQQNIINAVIPQMQTVVSGSTVGLRLTDDIYINRHLVAKGALISGVASLAGERLVINIKTIRWQDNILPVDLSVYDLDGLEGIYVPGAISRDVAKESTEQAMQGLGLASLDPSLGAQAASAGIQAAKSLIGKKVKQVKVTLQAGYVILLKDNNEITN